MKIFGAICSGAVHGRGRVTLLAALVLAAITIAAFSPVLTASFVNFDDSMYVTENAHVKAGLAWSSVVWAFTNIDVAFYYPLTWLSHMLDCQLFGLWAGGHHLDSLLLHVANALLLFAFLLRATEAKWRSFVVAALFALHPLHVESVAWIAERKDVLSTFFLMLTLCAYLWYIRCPSASRYLAIAALFLAALMAKSMVVTAPALLLLLDVWPLQRMNWPGRGRKWLGLPDDPIGPGRRSPGFLVAEKIPLLVLSGVFVFLTLISQQAVGTVAPLDKWPLTARLANVVVAYAGYLVQMVVPVNLGVLYPIPPEGWPWSRVLLSGLLIALVTVAIVRWGRGRPYLSVGWLWYLGSLVPVIGLVQVGQQASADRYTYVPLVGVFVMLAWGGAELADRWKVRPALRTAAVGILIAALATGTYHQAGFWRDSEALFRRTLSVTRPNYGMLNALGLGLVQAGHPKEAIPYLKRATQMDPDTVDAWGNLGNAFRDEGKIAPAVACYHRVLELDSKDTKALQNLGLVLEKTGDLEAALDAFKRQADLEPRNGAAQMNLGRLLAQTGHMDEAAQIFRRAVHLVPRDPKAHLYLGLALDRLGKPAAAEKELRTALEAARRAGDLDLARNIEVRLAAKELGPPRQGGLNH